jgi:hypothetical protein
MNTGMFSSFSINKLLYQDESEGITYAVQYTCQSLDVLKEYQSNHATKLQEAHAMRYKDKYVAFRSILEVQEEG